MMTKELTDLLSPSLWFWMAVAAMLMATAAFLYFLLKLCSNAPDTQRSSLRLKMLTSLLLSIWLVGVVLYYMAFSLEVGEHTTGWGELLRAGLCSLELFAASVDGDVMAALSEGDNGPWLRAALSLTGFVATGCMLLLMLSLVYSRFRHYLRLWWLSCGSLSGLRRLYVFFGVNEASVTLAKSIRESCTEPYRIVFVEQPISGDDDNETSAWSSLKNMFTHRKEIFQQVDNAGAHLAIASESLGDVETDHVLDGIGLGVLRRIVQKMNKAAGTSLHLFFLSDDENENVQHAPVLQHDATLRQCARRPGDTDGQGVAVTIYCHARYNSVNRTIEDLDPTSGVSLRIVDSSRLSVELLKRQPEHHPVNFVGLDTSMNLSGVTTPFTSLVVGFGETGKDAVRFLYEFGAFLDATSTDADTRRSPFYCHIVDCHMQQVEGSFRNSFPAMFAARNRDGQPLLTLHDCDLRSDRFYAEVLSQLAAQLNYVVIAVGDDELGMTFAVRIFNYVRRLRGRDLGRFRIYVRSYKRELQQHLQSIADHYNKNGQPCIQLFGHSDAIYRHEVIVDDYFAQQGKTYYEAYCTTPTWDGRRRKILNSYTDAQGVQHPTLEELQSLRRKEGQDRANALHAQTKLIVLDAVCTSERLGSTLSSLASRLFTKADGQQRPQTTRTQRNSTADVITYPGLTSDEQLLMRNMARFEHLRWNASHEVLGYQPQPEGSNEHFCNETTMRHNCIITWEQLEEESTLATRQARQQAAADGQPQPAFIDYQAFDYGVVETTIGCHFA